MTEENRQRRLHAPREDGAVLAEPPLAQAGALIAGNRARLARLSLNILGRPLADLRRQALEDTLAAARGYLQDAGEPLPDRGGPSLFMAGHQPELFHPGVWVKNFALYRLAGSDGATPINLVVDNDIAKSTSLHVPVLASADTPWPYISGVPIDRWTGEVPYEERTVRDESFFAALPDRVEPLLAGWNFVPLLAEFWEEVRRQADRTPLLGERLVAARRTLERRWGCHNLELPVSLLCRTESFAWFACHVLANLERFHAHYNTCVHDHRRRYGIRSRNHPVPDLTKEQDWLETPFWAWESGKQERARLFARQIGKQVELRAGGRSWPALPLDPAGGPAHMIGVWNELDRRGLKVRSRALTNTLFARVFLADLFIHGIGGGKYDELTDEIIRRFYQCEPPGYLVLSATLLLPLPAYPVNAQMPRRLAREVRDLRYNPERHLPTDALADREVRDLTAQKAAWIKRRPASAQERRERFQVLRKLSGQLSRYVTRRLEEAQQELIQRQHEVAANVVLQRRDYPFCLYPERLLKPFCTQFLA